MSQWARSHPEEMAEIARLPMPQQRPALADAARHVRKPTESADVEKDEQHES